MRLQKATDTKGLAPTTYVLVAQLDRASDSDSEGRRFESCQARQRKRQFLQKSCRFLYFPLLSLLCSLLSKIKLSFSVKR